MWAARFTCGLQTIGPAAVTTDRMKSRGVSGSRAFQFTCLGLILLTSGTLRALSASGDLWLDELWSLSFALGTDSIWEVLVGINHDNNHWLNTIYLRLVGDVDDLILYRGLAVLTGIGTVLVAMLGHLRKGLFVTVTVGTLLGFSHILVHFQSEARGYGPAIFFAVCAYVALERFMEERRRLFGALFSVSATLALLSQLTFVWVFAGLAAWSWAALSRDGRDRAPGTGRKSLLRWLGLHVAPGLTILFLLLFDVRYWTIGGSHPNPTGAALESLTRLSVGAIGPSWLVATVGVAIVVVMLVEVVRMFRHSDPRAWFFAIAVFIGPGAFILLMNLAFLYPRYLVLSVPFALLLLAQPLNRLHLRPGGQRTVWATILVLFLALNLSHTQTLIADGRGQYQDALTYILDSSEGEEVAVAVSSETPQGSVIEFYANRIEGGDRLATIELKEFDTPPSWILVQRVGETVPPADALLAADSYSFEFHRRFPHSGPSGWTWDTYRLREH